MLLNSVDTTMSALCDKQKLERDKAVNELSQNLPQLENSFVHDITSAFLLILNNHSSPWESLHGCLCGLKVIILGDIIGPETDVFTQVRTSTLALLTHSEVRVRLSSGEVLGVLCCKDQGATYESTRDYVLGLVRSNLEREQTSDEASQEEHESTKKLLMKLGANNSFEKTNTNVDQVFHDTAGWRNLETSMKCLEEMINGALHNFLPFIDQELLDLIFISLNHTNRFVRETGYNVCGALVATGAGENSDLLEENPMLIHGDQLAHYLGKGLADNWSQVRMASSIATRKFLISMPEPVRERFYHILLPRICLNRYYVAEGVRIYSQETWKQVTGLEGKILVQKYIESVVKYYIESTKADNHAVREAACACIAELAVKIPEDAVRPLVQVLLDSLITCFNDDSWPVRDAACLACGNFVSCFPEESRPSMDALYPLFFNNLQDSILSVRQGAAVALASVVKVYGNDMLQNVVSKINEGLLGIEKQPSESDKYGDLDTGLTTYGVAKRLRDNDASIHSNKQMYSCGSLAPKMGRGGGCTDCKFRRPPQPWEITDGCVYLISELSNISITTESIIKLMPLVSKTLDYKHYTSHLALHETVCKVLPIIAKGIGKKHFKPMLHLFMDSIFYSLASENALTSSSASQCLVFLSQFLGPSILRSRVEESNPSFLHLLEQTLQSQHF